MRSEVEVVDIAAVALVSSDSRLALALALGVALKAPGADGVAVAGDAVVVFFAFVVVCTTYLAVGTVAVGYAVQAVASMSGALI